MYKDVLLAIDLNEEHSWKKALPTAVEFCKSFGSVLHVVTVVPDFGMTVVGHFFPDDFQEKSVAAAGDDLDAFLARHAPEDLRIQPVVGYGSVYKEILRIAEDIKCSLIVMASTRPQHHDYLLGPNAARVVRHAKCSVLVVRD